MRYHTAVAADPHAGNNRRSELVTNQAEGDMKGKLSRRGFLSGAVAAAAATTLPAEANAQGPARTARYGDYLVYDKPGEDALPATDKDIEGPFYRDGAPLRTTLFEKGEKGDVLVVSGKVVARNGRPLAGVLLDVWQCNADGKYDNDDPNHPPNKDQFVLRGRLKTNENGEYEFTTIRPVPYPIGENQYRPAHIHLKASLEGYEALTTQIYFKGDKYNKTDPWYSAKREVDPKLDKDKIQRATFKVVLARA
jgi:protocatechuate 3,4-dioxygenase beta subunit